MTYLICDPPLTIDEIGEEIAQTLRVFHSTGDTVEIRALGAEGGRPRNVAGYYRDFDQAGRDVARLESRNPSGIYFTMNEISPALYARSPDRLTDAKSTTTDADVIRRRWLLIDVDPERPAGVSSSDEELERAQVIAARVRNWMVRDLGFPLPTDAISGNGWHCLFPLDLPNDAESKALVEGVLKAAKAQAELLHPEAGPRCAIDVKVGNAARITKLYATLSRKGHDLPERPHRRSRLVYVPNGGLS